MTRTHIPDPELTKRNNRMLMWLGLLLVGMGVFAWALVPFYQLVCRKYGVGTVPQLPNKNVVSTGIGSRTVTVHFLGLINAGTPATLEPLVPDMVVHVGETREVNYRFTNLADHPLEFQAVHSVTPPRADADFHKLQCFCFTRQTLKPHETKVMPVSFWVDPKLESIFNTVTLQYTLYALHPEKLVRR
jgi:cytochrome c oxidase assembly protein subunit 11